MFFNSIDFAIFLPVVFFLYWFVTPRNLKVQNFFLLVASYVFYAFWDWRFLSLILFSTVVDYAVGLALAKYAVQHIRKALVSVSIVVNIGFLGVFKYFDFFAENFSAMFRFFGYDFGIDSLNIVLPVGISFYTFQTLSYSIDVYRRKMEPTRDFVAFASFVSFFPQLVAGPIERATHLLPQFFQKRHFHYAHAVDGMRQILWGLIKKMVIADNCAEYANQVFNHSAEYSGSTLLLGVVFFAFQIYGDFSGYSDIAIGTSRLFGFRLYRNFSFPYFSRDIAEFWRRWHISLSTWFRDYVYIPLGGSRGSGWIRIRNIFIIFLLSGFWHGANWTFVVWGALNALYFLPLLLMKKHRTHLDSVAAGRLFPSFREINAMLYTFVITAVAWVFFRAESLTHAVSYLKGMFSVSMFQRPQVDPAYESVIFLLAFIVIEWLGREHEYALEKLGGMWSRPVRWAVYYLLVGLIALYGGVRQEFIYFQF